MQQQKAGAVTVSKSIAAHGSASEFGRDRLQHRTRDNAAVGDAEAITEFERGAADDDLLALEAVQGCRVAAQYVDEDTFGIVGSGC